MTENGSFQTKPCLACRRRKIKCDKVRPCSNCTRSRQLCTYDSLDVGSSVSSDAHREIASDVNILERLAKLEGVVATILRSDEHSERLSRDSVSNSERLLDGSFSLGVPQKEDSLVNDTTYPVGQQIYQEGYSAYFDSDFWPGMITEIEDLRRLFQASKTSNHVPALISPSIPFGEPLLGLTDLKALYPTTEESNLLCKVFFDSVNPFVRVLHETNFGRDIAQYRRGFFLFPKEFEALLFSIYTLTVSTLRPEVVERAFSTSKKTLLARFQHAAQVALMSVDFFKTDKILTLQALLHYVTYLFQQNLYRDAISLLGIVARLAQTMGHHRDPSHFSFTLWVCEIRRRIFNHLSCLDALMLNSFGAESCLPQTSDSRPPRNANDREWHASRFAKASAIPPNAVGFKDMTYVLAQREIAELIRQLSRLDCNDFQSHESLIRHTEMSLNEKYLRQIDRSNPSQTVVAAMAEVNLSSLRLRIRYRQTKSQQSDPTDTSSRSTLWHAVELLEAFEYHSTTFADLNWDWIFRDVVPWLAIAIVLTQLHHSTQASEIDRARKQIDIVFRKFGDPESEVSRTPMWQLVAQLKEYAETRWNEGKPSQNLMLSLVGQQRDGDPSLDNSSGINLAFTDETISSFQLQAMQDDSNMFYDSIYMQDIENLPWLPVQMPQ